MPLRKWTDQTVRGKILYDVINTIILLMLRKKFLNTGASMKDSSIGDCLLNQFPGKVKESKFLNKYTKYLLLD